LTDLVSVIIPTVNGDPHIDKCTKAVRQSTYKNVEVIVVNEGLERSAQRNIGIDRAKGKYLLFLDSDQIPTRGLINECVSKIKRCSGIYIPEYITTRGFFGRLRNWERQFYTGTPIDCVRFVEASWCPRFNIYMSGPEDSDWDRRIKGTKVIANHYLYHQDDIGVKQYFKKKAYYSKSMWLFDLRNPNDKITNFWWRCFGVYFEQGKWKRVFCKPHYFILICFINFIRGVIYCHAKYSS